MSSASMAAPLTIPEFVRDLAERREDAELIVTPDARLGYAEADERSARMARSLIAAGVGKGTRVGIWLPNGPDWIAAWLAATRIGAVAVPINTFYQTRELGWILRHADVEVLLTRAAFLTHDYVARLEAAAPGLAEAGSPIHVAALPCLRRVFVFGDCDRSWAEDAAALDTPGRDAPDEAFLAALEACVVPADPMIVLYSSGSTADPKGAIHTHGAVLRHSRYLASQRDLVASDRVWSPMPFFWVGGFVFAMMCNLQAGATTLCEDVFEPEQTLRYLERERATVAIGWPHFGKALADHPTRPDRDLSALRSGNVPDILPGVAKDPGLRPNSLGMTETCGPHTWSAADGAVAEVLRGTFGSAVEGVVHKVVDPQTGERLPPGSVGEICVRGRSVMQGLHKVEREDAFDAEGFYHTGDAGSFDANGVLTFVARLGDMIKTGGANVTPGEVEQVLGVYPEVKAAHVVGVPDPERGQNVAAVVVLEDDARADAAGLKTRLKGELSAYKVPRHLWIETAAVLPFTDSGKLDKRRLAELLAERISGGDVG